MLERGDLSASYFIEDLPVSPLAEGREWFAFRKRADLIVERHSARLCVIGK